jgi:multidrug efflux pump subunit AcrA (membrane-fusion protein)
MTHATSEQLAPTKNRFPKASPKNLGLLAGGLILLAGGVWAIQQSMRHSTTESAAITDVQPPQVETLTVTPKVTAQQVELSGTIRSPEQAVLSTRVMGRITYLPFEAGDRVQKGEVIARINVTDIAAQTNQAKSGVLQSEAELARAQATLSQLESQRLEAQASLKLAQIEQARMAKLRIEGAVAQSLLDQANTNLDVAKARVAQADSAISQAKAAIARTQAAIRQAESAVTSAAVSESYGTITAPFNGVVTQKMAYEGEMTTPGTALVKLENPDRLELEISVPEDNLRYVQVGQPVKVWVDAVNRTFDSRIQQIVPAADPNSRSFLVKIPLSNPGNLISGMFGRLELPTAETQKAIMVPTSAILRRGQLEGVYVLTAGAKPDQAVATLRWVKTGKTRNDQVEITSGLSAGDRVVIRPIAQLSDGQSVVVK